MYHYFGTVTDSKGNARANWQVECVANSDGSTVQVLYSDQNSTPIVTVSGIANRALTDEWGNFNFFVTDGTYNLKYYDNNAVYRYAETYIPMYGPQAQTSYEIAANLTVNSQAAASANAAVIQNAIDTAASTGDVAVVTIKAKRGTYYTNQLVLKSGVTLEIGAGVTLKKPDNYPVTMLINYQALQGTPGRDTNIAIIGAGTLDGNVAGQVASLTQATFASPAVNSFLYGVQGEIAMLQVDGFICTLRNIKNTLGFGLQFIGTDAKIQGMRFDSIGVDQIHINGPSSKVIIDDCTGFSNDQCIALNAWDWHRSGPTVGDIDDVKVTRCAYYGSKGTRTNGLIAYLPGTRSTGTGTGTGNVKNVEVDGCVWDPTKGTVTPASSAIQPTMIKDQIQGSETSGTGTIDNIKHSNCKFVIPNSNCAGVVLSYTSITADGQADVTIRNFVVESSLFDCSAGQGVSANVIKGKYNFWRIQGMVFRDNGWIPVNSGASTQAFVEVGVKNAPDEIEVDGLTIYASAATGVMPAVLSNNYDTGLASSIKCLTVDRVRSAPGVQTTGCWLYVIAPITQLRSRGHNIVGTGGGSDNQGILFAGASAAITQGVVQDSYFSGVKEMVMVNQAAASAGSLSFNDCNIVSCTHPVFMNTGVALDVTFARGNVDSAANLARVANAGATLNLSMVGTTSSGAGATTVTVASGALRIRQMDRIAFSTSVVLTPQNNDRVFFSGTPAYTGVNVVSGTLAGEYIYRGTGTVGWIKLN